MNFDQYNKVDEFLTTLSNPGINPGLERVSSLFDLLDNPEKKFPSIHVVGTNGKGSTSAMIDSVLRAAGYRSALYTSPHLIHFGERLVVDGKPVSSELWMDALRRIKKIIEVTPYFQSDRPTYFEILTVAAILLISESHIDVAVVEAGMGGRLDATNMLGDVRLSVITPIAMDHGEYLGNTVESVAQEKFAVIREGGRAIFAGDGEGPLTGQFERTSSTKNADISVADRDYGLKEINIDLSGTSFALELPTQTVEITTPLVGLYQARNGRLAYGACRMLRSDFPQITEENIKKGLEKTKWPGRFEVLSKKPRIIVDGAHNPHGMAALVETISAMPNLSEIGIVYTSMADKDYRKVLEILSSLPCRLFCTSIPGNSRCASSEDILNTANTMEWTYPPTKCADPGEALKEAMKYPTVLCCGSLYLVTWISLFVRKHETLLS